MNLNGFSFKKKLFEMFRRSSRIKDKVGFETESKDNEAKAY